jgi:F-type H+-transporting ATPase subunit b
MFTTPAPARLWLSLALGWSVVMASATALGQPVSRGDSSDVSVSEARDQSTDAPRRRTARPHGVRPGDAPPEGASPTRRPRAQHAAPAQGEGHGAPAHGSASKVHEEEEHVPSFSDINWAWGLLGESDVTEPSLLFRPKGMPVPLLATLFNWGVLVGMIVLMARKHLPAALRRRKEQIVEGMQAAARMKEESSRRLAEYQKKLDTIGQEIERVKAEMVRAGELERQRILAEAVERRTRMERDARRLIETELQNAAEELRREVASHALRFAEETVRRALLPADQQRLFEEGVGNLQKLGARSLGGQP